MKKEICPTCKEERKVLNVNKANETKEEVIFSCRHKLIKINLCDEIKVKEELGLKGKSEEKDSRGKPLKEFKTKVTDEQQHTIEKDRSSGKTKVMQRVWKKDKDGRMKLFHGHDKTS